LGSQIQDLKNTDQALSKTIAKIDIDKKAIEENITKTIETRIADIKRIYDEQNVDINDLKAEIEKYKKQYALLDDEIIKAKEEFDFYNRHLGEDSDIVLKLREYKIQSLDSFTSEIDRLESSIKTELVELDEKIKGIIEEQEKINEDISRRNGTSK
jgi:predicted  nucleic acid-binding Zn-ribbon protein